MVIIIITFFCLFTEPLSFSLPLFYKEWGTNCFLKIFLIIDEDGLSPPPRNFAPLILNVSQNIILQKKCTSYTLMILHNWNIQKKIVPIRPDCKMYNTTTSLSVWFLLLKQKRLFYLLLLLFALGLHFHSSFPATNSPALTYLFCLFLFLFFFQSFSPHIKKR